MAEVLHTSKIDLSELALGNNLTFIRELIGPECRLSSVVKGNAYGHGIDVFVPAAQRFGIDHFSVFSAQEAERVMHAASPGTEIMIMGMVSNDDLDWVIKNNISFFVFDSERLTHAIKSAERVGKPARIHLELETGMNRTGFIKKDLSKALKLIQSHMNEILVEGVCTHLAGAESVANYLRIQKQFRVFQSGVKWLDNQGISPRYRHVACSAATITYPKTRLDLVRIGIMQYGFWPSRETLVSYLSKQKIKTDPLNRVITWRSKVMSIKSVKTGEFIGYGTTYMAERDMHIAAVPVGYADGYSRALSNQGRLLINGHRVGVVGMVNMNMLIADISSIEDTKPGDEVILIGEQGDLKISVGSFGELSNQLNYELLTRLPKDIPRNLNQH